MICLLTVKIKFVIKYFIMLLNLAEECAVCSCVTCFKYT